jgi:formate/nitrite transporter FocA (FNT family)
MRSWAILLATSIVISMVLYRSTQRPLVSALSAALVAASALQFLGRIELGYFDQFWPIAAAVSFAAAFSVSLIVVLIWRGVELGEKRS